ncbi:hypothetical protein EPR50_G00213510 [Perca flavescens]|uniref:UPAR/Ly6 domain-containing protein n=1 Tax=Perca flavescens TaxID=8167 RepID=A0A484C8J3_PERFV|nr:hypothetical protein EPR50_G00213510 [Perca flavescens]
MHFLKLAAWQKPSEVSTLNRDNLPEIGVQTRENMKTVILALLVLLVVSHGEALTCWCGGLRKCAGRTEVCSGSNDVCASVRFAQYPANKNNFWGCYTESNCRKLNYPGVASCTSCRTDLCQ